jgi:hypothetical protein
MAEVCQANVNHWQAGKKEFLTYYIIGLYIRFTEYFTGNYYLFFTGYISSTQYVLLCVRNLITTYFTPTYNEFCNFLPCSHKIYLYTVHFLWRCFGLEELTAHTYHSIDWLQMALIPPVRGSADNSLSVVNCSMYFSRRILFRWPAFYLLNIRVHPI